MGWDRRTGGAKSRMLKAQGKLWSIREWSSGLWFLFGKPGMLRRVAGDWLRFLRKDFHPWQLDNRDLIRAWEAEQDPDAVPADAPLQSVSR